tara:strand:+ start:7666 stop:7932 length:267 start_codon:yes stop_codon:yes gene_type:complete
MKTLPILTVLALVGLTAVPAFAAESEPDLVHGRATAALERSLRDRGIVTAGFEEWGALIRAWVPNGKGGTSMVFLDPDTLELVTPGRS